MKDSVSVEIPYRLLSQIKQLGSFSTTRRTCRTEIDDNAFAGYNLTAYASWEKEAASDAASALTKLVKMLQDQYIPDFQI